MTVTLPTYPLRFFFGLHPSPSAFARYDFSGTAMLQDTIANVGGSLILSSHPKPLLHKSKKGHHARQAVQQKRCLLGPTLQRTLFPHATGAGLQASHRHGNCETCDIEGSESAPRSAPTPSSSGTSSSGSHVREESSRRTAERRDLQVSSDQEARVQGKTQTAGRR